MFLRLSKIFLRLMLRFTLEPCLKSCPICTFEFSLWNVACLDPGLTAFLASQYIPSFSHMLLEGGSKLTTNYNMQEWKPHRDTGLIYKLLLKKISLVTTIILNWFHNCALDFVRFLDELNRSAKVRLSLLGVSARLGKPKILL